MCEHLDEVGVPLMRSRMTNEVVSFFVLYGGVYCGPVAIILCHSSQS